MGRSKGRAHSSKAGRSTPAKETGNDKECLFCKTVIQNAKPLKKLNCSDEGYVCLDCTKTEWFTMEDLQIFTRRTDDMSAFKKCSVLQQFEIPDDCVASDVLIGFFEWKKCGICSKVLRKNDDINKHNEALHGLVEQCNLGCYQYSTPEKLEEHKKSCGIWCPKCNKWVDNDLDKHFNKELYEVFICPAHGCCEAFLHEDLDQICEHLLSYHVWCSPQNDEETMEN